jgi:hypothetical protein
VDIKKSEPRKLPLAFHVEPIVQFEPYCSKTNSPEGRQFQAVEHSARIAAGAMNYEPQDTATVQTISESMAGTGRREKGN